jgi:hypothetical protein
MKYSQLKSFENDCSVIEEASAHLLAMRAEAALHCSRRSGEFTTTHAASYFQLNF